METFDMARLPDSQRVAFYGAMFAMAAADQSIDREELALIMGQLDTHAMGQDAVEQLHGFIVQPPAFKDCLMHLSAASDELRFGAMVNLLDVAMADDIIEPSEKEALDEAARTLRLNQEQMEAIERFVVKAREIRERGLDDAMAEKTLKSAASGLTAVGVPITAVYFSGSVVGLSAAGITSGLAALGLGFGMVPGIGVAILVGTGVFLGVRWLLDGDGSRKKARAAEERERRAQLVIENLQGCIAYLAQRIEELQRQASTAEANREAVQALLQRMSSLKKILAKRERAMGV